MNVSIKSPYKWVGRIGLNFRFGLELWTNRYCDLLDTRGFESSGFKYWRFHENEPCQYLAHSMKELREHKKQHVGRL